ncbi:Nif11-like leader peptide family natural product precursor [Ancylothrix sp. C2]|nr:Nif11-like leader peptide family natural product precursor [Ancylothrix sp. D3o]
MSTESAYQFLSQAAHDREFQQKFEQAANAQEFMQIAEALGFDFTPEELKAVVKENSEGVKVRRQTGVWRWLRSVKWI